MTNLWFQDDCKAGYYMLTSTALSFARNLYHLLPSKTRTNVRAIQEAFSVVENGSLVVRVPEFQGAFEIGAKSHILLRVLAAGGCYEPSMAALVRKYVDPSKDVIDIGANVGFYTILAASLLTPERKVLSIEPTPGAIMLLSRNIQRNNQSQRVILYEGAATSTRRRISLNIVEGHEEYSSTATLSHPAVAGAAVTVLDVEGVSIDQLVAQFNLCPGFMKIDTEGTEYDVLLGSDSTLTEFRPIILCEIFMDDMLRAAGGTPGKSIELLRKHGYEVQKIDEANYLAIPQEKKHIR
jgi:FkbM family methyltransferase